MLLLVVDERDERSEADSIGDERCLVSGAGFGGVERTGVINVDRGRRAGGVYFLIVAIAVAVDADELSIGSDGLRRLIGPGRFSVSHEEADRCTP